MCTCRMQVAVTTLAAVTLLSAMAFADPPEVESSWQPQYHPTLRVKRAPGKIKIDGDLSDPGWQGAEAAKNFTQHHPVQEVAPPVRTEAFMTYDDENVYFAAVCYAPAGTVRASLCERERIFGDDNIGFFFDTFGDATRAYVINLNPYGIPYDALWSRGWGEDGSFDLIFESSGIVTDSGYQVEMAIPYSSLRFPNKPVQEWRVDFYRHHQRESHYSISWATYDLNEQCWPCRWGTVTGIENVSPGKGYEIMPTFVAHQSGSLPDRSDPSLSLANGDIYGEMSVQGKYAMSSNVTFEAAYNPDFSQVESDAVQIDVNAATSYYYPERRPFFQEGIDLFRTNFAIVRTRTVNKPLFAGKFSARFGKFSVATLSAYDEHTSIIIPLEDGNLSASAGKNMANMIAARRTLGRNTDVRLVATDRRIEGGGSGTVLSLDGHIGLSGMDQIRWQVMGTHTDELDGERPQPYWDVDTSFNIDSTIAGVDSTWIDPAIYFDNGRHTADMDGESFSGYGFLFGHSRGTRYWWSNLTYSERNSTYRADNGHQPTNAVKRLTGGAGYNFRFAQGLLERLSPNFGFGRIANFDNVRKNWWVSVGLNSNWRIAHTSVGGHATILNNERWRGHDFRGLWSVSLWFSMTPSSALEFGCDGMHRKDIGRWERPSPVYDLETTTSYWATIRPSDRLAISPSFNHSQGTAAEPLEREVNDGTVIVENVRLWKGYTARVRLNYQFSRELNLRIISQYSSFSERLEFDPLITYRINPFSIFYIGATHDFRTCDVEYPEYTDKNDNPFIHQETRMTDRQFFMKLQYLFQI
ncbi:MAG: carbohydrate binding family 9 domain-containing protein [Candidatus Zixiibacteriota bacterium]|nr:MAG: carbohydrate binding family 9 domain-containing protein [candidate division Zixibacteria bacterium]